MINVPWMITSIYLTFSLIHWHTVNKPAAELPTPVFITSKVDMDTTLFHWLNRSQRYQRQQNNTARLFTLSWALSHSTPPGDITRTLELLHYPEKKQRFVNGSILLYSYNIVDTLFGKGSHAFSSFLSLSDSSEITSLAPCALSLYFQDMYNCLSSPLITTGLLSEFDAHSRVKSR